MAAPLLPELRIKYPSGESKTIELTRLRTTIGRSARNDVSIADAFASRVHAELRFEGGSVWISDLGSANGTRVNGEVIHSVTELKSGDEVRIGETLFEVVLHASAANANAAVITSGSEALDPARTVSFTVRGDTGELNASGTSTRNELLGLIGKVGVTLLSSSGLDETLEQVAGLVFEAVPAERCVLMLKDGSAEEGMRTAVARSRDSKPIDGVLISHTVLDEVLVRGKAVLTADAQHDPKYASQTMSLLGVRSVLAVPLSVDGADVFGMVYADAPGGKDSFTEEHLNILTTLASVAAIRVERARFLEEQLAKERYERELALASEIQQRFLPARAPAVPGFEMQGISFSCYEIGGDYYDFIDRNDGRMLIIIGDVSGKGTGAALLMSSVHAAMHAQVVAGAPLEEIPERLNEYLSANTPSNTFVTLFLAELDTRTGGLRYINAGHNPPLLCRADGGIVTLTEGGMPLGLMRSAQYDCGSDMLGVGDSVVMYSDGVTEAVDPLGEEFGVARLQEAVRESAGESPAGLRDGIEKTLSDFTATAPQSDDITLVIIKKTA